MVLNFHHVQRWWAGVSKNYKPDNRYRKQTESYSESEVDTLLAGYYTQAQVDALFSNYYTKAEIDALLDTDPLYSSVDSIANFEDGDGSTTVADAKSGLWAVSGASSGVTTDQAQFGTGSFLTGGTNGSLRRTNPPTIGTSDFTIEFFAAPIQANEPFGRLFQTVNGDTITGISLVVDGTSENANLELYSSSNGASWDVINGTQILASPISDQFYHFCFMRKSGVLYAFVGGSLAASGAYAGALQSGSEWIFGGQSVGISRNAGWAIDAIRTSPTNARYDETGFTPPSTPYPTS